MPLPQQVINRLTQEPETAPGWSGGVILFSLGLFIIAVALYVGMAYGYEPYINSQIDSVKNQINALTKNISQADEANLISFYSQITNVQSTLANHVVFSAFLSWLEAHTEANVYYNSLSFSAGNRVTLLANAANESDVNQQIAIFESSPDVSNVSVSNVAQSTQNNTWQFGITLTMNPAVLHATVAAGTSNATTTATPNP